jgi:hypothetical protein
VLFSKIVINQSQTAWIILTSEARSKRSLLRPIHSRYTAALHAAEAVFLENTADERNAAESAQTAARNMFQTTVNAGSDKHEALMTTLPETDKAARTQATAAFHDILRTADSLYNRAVGPTAMVLKALEARAMIAYEAAAGQAFAAFVSEMKAATAIDTTENRSACHAGCYRFIFQEEGGKR